MFGHKNSYLVLAKKRIVEMEHALKTLERMAPKAISKPRAKKLMTEMKKRHSQFQVVAHRMKAHASEADARMKRLSAAGNISWRAFRSALAKSQKAFTRANRKAGKAITRAVR